MKINLRDYSDNILIFLNSLITFLLIFDSNLEIPSWLQTFGRLHPMLLHFPIVLLLLALLLEFIHFKILIRIIKFNTWIHTNIGKN